MTTEVKRWILSNWMILLALCSATVGPTVGVVVWAYSTFPTYSIVEGVQARASLIEGRQDRQAAAYTGLQIEMRTGFDKLRDKMDDQTETMIQILREKK